MKKNNFNSEAGFLSALRRQNLVASLLMPLSLKNNFKAKTLFTFVFLFLLQTNIFAQVDFAQWNGSTDLVPTILNNNVVASSVTGSGLSAGPTPSYDGIIGQGWPVANTLDTSKYFQITINPILDAIIVLNEIQFKYKGDCKSYQIRYSKADDFSNSTLLTTVSNAIASTTDTYVNLPGLNISINAGEKIYLRFYAYNGGGNWKLMNGNLLKLRGTVTQNPSALNGTYHIGSSASASFPSITNAVAALNSLGVSGDVNFLLDNKLYNTSTGETFPIILNSFVGNTSYKVTFKPNAGTSVRVEASNNTSNNPNNTVEAVFKLNGADNIIFDGSNTTNGITKDLTLYNTNTSNFSRAVIWIASENSTNGANNNEIKNVVLQQFNKYNGSLDFSTGIFAGGASSVTSVAEAANSNTSVTNVTFIKVGQAIYVNGNSNINLLSSKWYIRNNTIGNTTTDNTLKPYVGINFLNVKDYEVSGNIINGLINDVNQSFAGKHAAVWIEGLSNGKIFNNIISNLSNSLGNGTPQSRGIYVDASNNLIYNNFISNIYSSVSGGGNGIYINAGSANKIYYNTIVMNNSNNPSGSSCLYVNGANTDIKSNIFYNSQNIGSQYAVYSNISKTSLNIDYNDYYAPIVGFIGGSSQANLTNWKTATGQDSNSQNISPTFISTADFHLQNVTANDNLQGVAISDITADIDGDLRIKPYMGADEIAVPSVKIDADTQIICAGAAVPLTFTATPANGGNSPTYQWQVNGINIPGATSSTFVSANLALGNIITVVMNSKVKSKPITLVTQITTYDEKNGWSLPPLPNLSAIIQSDYSSATQDLNVCSLTVSNNSKVTIKAGDSFKIQNDLKVDSGSTLTVESDGNLVQINDAIVNTSSITAKRNIKVRKGSREYNYLISPIKDFNLKNIFNNDPSLVRSALYYNEGNDYFYNSSAVYIAGRGLAIKEPLSFSSEFTSGSDTFAPAVFVGAPANGVINFALAKAGNGFNLAGNPYPSAIDLQKLYNLNSTKIESTFNFWDNANNSVYTQQGSNYDGNSYARYNAVNNTAIPAGRATATGEGVYRYAKVGQGFMVQALSAGTSLLFNNSLREIDNHTAKFFGGKMATNTAETADRYFLELTSPGGIINTQAVVYFPAGDNAFGKDDSVIEGDISDIFYSIADSQKVIIQGKSPFSSADHVKVGANVFENGIYTISSDNLEGIFASGQNIYLKDNIANTITNLSQNSYSFQATKGDTANRFEITYKPESFLATNNLSKTTLQVYQKNKDFIISSPSQRISMVEVYDTSGRILYKVNAAKTEVTLASERLARGILILNINLANGENLTRKIRN